MGDEKLRLFTAARIPRTQLEWLDDAAGELMSLRGARWTTIDNRHVTLNFLGWIEAGLFERVTAAVDDVAHLHAPAQVSLSALGAFPSPRRARVLWAGVADERGLLPALARDLGERLRDVGYEPEERPYTAHVTLARFKTPRSLDGLLPDLPPPPGSFTIDRITLFRSRLSPSGARYEVVHEAYLTASAAGANGTEGSR